MSSGAAMAVLIATAGFMLLIGIPLLLPIGIVGAAIFFVVMAKRNG